MTEFRPFISLEDSISFLKNKCKEKGKLPTSFNGYYCGITNDIERRAKEHNTNVFGAIECANADVAKNLEAMMHDEGFDTGNQLGNGQEDSKYVYAYKKVDCVTNESLDN